ncbi:MAG: hypothetical protein ACW96U_01435 [Candidatus Heimdallarchaeaceae archaeon]|jgi:hypothetical protein
MKDNPKTREDDKKTISVILRLSVSASLAALGIVLSTVVVLIPNIEFISVTIFLISLLFGTYYGLLGAVSIALVYEFIVTTIYSTAGLVIPFKLICYIGLALLAGFGRKVFTKLSFWEFGILGGIFALIYDIVTTIGGLIPVFLEATTIPSLLSVLILGIPFTLVHFFGNFILFSLITPIIGWIKAAFRYRGIKLLMISSIFDEFKDTKNSSKDGDSI